MDVRVGGAELVRSLVSPPDGEDHAGGEQDDTDTAQRGSQYEVNGGVRIIIALLPLVRKFGF